MWTYCENVVFSGKRKFDAVEYNGNSRQSGYQLAFYYVLETEYNVRNYSTSYDIHIMMIYTVSDAMSD